LAAQRVQSGLERDQLIAAPGMMNMHDTYEGLCAIGEMLTRPDSTPLRGEIATLVNAFGDDPPDDIRRLFPLLRSFGEAALKAPGPADGNGDTVPTPSTDAREEREEARQKLDAVLNATMYPYLGALDSIMEKSEEARSPENIAALMAPRDESSLLMQRMEDSNLRQLWRLTDILVKVRNGELG